MNLLLSETPPDLFIFPRKEENKEKEEEENCVKICGHTIIVHTFRRENRDTADYHWQGRSATEA